LLSQLGTGRDSHQWNSGEENITLDAGSSLNEDDVSAVEGHTRFKKRDNIKRQSNQYSAGVPCNPILIPLLVRLTSPILLSIAKFLVLMCSPLEVVDGI
jgi:hypothetical protein